MDPQQWVSARDALSALLTRQGMPPAVAEQAAAQLISTLDRPGPAGKRDLVLLGFHFSVESRDGEEWVSKEQLERALAQVEHDPGLAEEFRAG